MGARPLSFSGYRKKHIGPDRKGRCYICYRQDRDHRNDHTRCEVHNREKAQYFQRHPEKIPQRNQPGGPDPRK